jgi:lysozyme family protein
LEAFVNLQSFLNRLDDRLLEKAAQANVAQQYRDLVRQYGLTGAAQILAKNKYDPYYDRYFDFYVGQEAPARGPANKFTQHKNDHPTSLGVTTAMGLTADEVRALSMLPPEQAKQIAKHLVHQEYYRPVSKLPEHLRGPMADVFVHGGRKPIVQSLQRHLKVNPSGVLDQATIQAMQGADQRALKQALIEARGKYLSDLGARPDKAHFARGWLKKRYPAWVNYTTEQYNNGRQQAIQAAQGPGNVTPPKPTAYKPQQPVSPVPAKQPVNPTPQPKPLTPRELRVKQDVEESIQRGLVPNPFLNKQGEFSPDYTPEQLKALGVYDEVYHRTRARLASMDKWPEEWLHPEDPGGWLEWYEKYSKGRRLPEEDERQIKRWLGMKRRHGGPLSKNPTPRRAYALQHWAIDPTRLVDDPKALRRAMEEYKARKERTWQTKQAGALVKAYNTLLKKLPYIPVYDRSLLGRYRPYLETIRDDYLGTHHQITPEGLAKLRRTLDPVERWKFIDVLKAHHKNIHDKEGFYFQRSLDRLRRMKLPEPAPVKPTPPPVAKPVKYEDFTDPTELARKNAQVAISNFLDPDRRAFLGNEQVLADVQKYAPWFFNKAQKPPAYIKAKKFLSESDKNKLLQDDFFKDMF